MNPKGENVGICDLEGIKGFPAEPSEMDLEFDIWLGMLNFTSWGTKSQLQYYDSFLIHALIPLIKPSPINPNI